MENLRTWADYYYNCGFNVTHIIPELNIDKANNIFKAPTNDRYKLIDMRQSLEELHSFDWENSTGIGCVLGFKKLRAIDFDFKKEYYKDNDYIKKEKDHFIKLVLRYLDLPQNYEWVVKTPGRGFHVLFFAEKHPFKMDENLTKAFFPNEKSFRRFNYYDPPCHDSFTHLELRWDKHLVLPPSKNKYGKRYKFYFGDIPKNKPLEINLESIKNLLNEFCYEECPFSGNKGYNLDTSSFAGCFENGRMLMTYSNNEYLDFSSIFLKEVDGIDATENGANYKLDTFNSLIDVQYDDCNIKYSERDYDSSVVNEFDFLTDKLYNNLDDDYGDYLASIDAIIESDGYDNYETDHSWCSHDDCNYEADTFDALTDGQCGDYDDWCANGGDFDSLMEGLGY